HVSLYHRTIMARKMAVLLWTMWMVGCDGSSAAPVEESLVRLRECNLLTAGDFNIPSDEESTCRMKCIAEFTDCTQVEHAFCRPNLFDYVLSDCMHECYSFSCD